MTDTAQYIVRYQGAPLDRYGPWQTPEEAHEWADERAEAIDVPRNDYTVHKSTTTQVVEEVTVVDPTPVEREKAAVWELGAEYRWLLGDGTTGDTVYRVVHVADNGTVTLAWVDNVRKSNPNINFGYEAASEIKSFRKL